MDLEHLIELILPPIIGVLEMMGIFVVAVSAVRAFAEYLAIPFCTGITRCSSSLPTALPPGWNLKWPPRS